MKLKAAATIFSRCKLKKNGFVLLFANRAADCLLVSFVVVIFSPKIQFSLLLSLTVVRCLILWWANLRMPHFAHAHCSCFWLTLCGLLLLLQVVSIFFFCCHLLFYSVYEQSSPSLQLQRWKTWHATARRLVAKWHTNDIRGFVAKPKRF